MLLFWSCWSRETLAYAVALIKLIFSCFNMCCYQAELFKACELRERFGQNSLDWLRFSSRRYIFNALGNPIIMRSSTSPGSFPNVAFESVPIFVWLTTAIFRPFKEAEDRRPLLLSASLLFRRSMSLALCLQTVSPALQHVGYSEP